MQQFEEEKHKYYRIVYKVQKWEILMQYLYCIQDKMSIIVDFPRWPAAIITLFSGHKFR